MKYQFTFSLLLVVVASFSVGVFFCNRNHSDERLIKQQMETLKAERDSVMKLNGIQNMVFKQQMDSIYSALDSAAHQKTLSQTTINHLKTLLQQQETTRKNYLKNIQQ